MGRHIFLLCVCVFVLVLCVPMTGEFWGISYSSVHKLEKLNENANAKSHTSNIHTQPPHTTHVLSAFESALRDWSSVPVCIYICEYVNTSRLRIPPQPSIDLALN